jgi:acyl-CoA dehydrogenase
MPEPVVHLAPRRAGPLDLARLTLIIRDMINPGASRRDRDVEPIDRALFAQLATTGVLAETLPRALGGAGAGWHVWGRVLRWMAYTADELSLPFTISYQQTLAQRLCSAGRPELIDRHVRPMMRGERFGSFCWTEGSDAFSFRTTATLDGDEWIVSGKKGPISAGALADFFLVYARAPAREDVVAILVERGDPGVSTEECAPMGLRGTGMALLRLDEVRVGPDRVLAASDGIGHGQVFLNERRIALACVALGKLEALFELMVANLAARRRHGLPVTEMQAVQASLGRFWSSLEAVRAMVDRMLHLLGRQPVSAADAVWDPTVAVTKYFAIEQMSAMLAIAQRLLGGCWYFDEEPFGRWMRDLQGLIAAAGTQGILEVDLGIWGTSGGLRTARSAPQPDSLALMKQKLDDDLTALSREELVAEVERLRAGIRAHRDASGHDLCWHHPRLWGLLPERSDPQPEVPDWPQFMRGCVRYRQSLDQQLPHASRVDIELPDDNGS